MRILILFLIPLFTTSYLHAQNDSLKAILYAGVSLHDQGDYDGAIQRYDEVIAKDPGYLLAWYEKSLTLFTARRYQDCVNLCKEVLKNFREGDELDGIFVNYGSAVDAMGKPNEAIRIYTQGIRKFNHYLLFFNRGVTEYHQDKMQDAMKDFQQTLELRPLHASSHQYLGYSVYGQNSVAGLMCLTSFLLIEPGTDRSKKNLKLLQDLLGSYAKQTGEKTVTISIGRDLLSDNKNKPDDFSRVELRLALRSGADFTDSAENKSAGEKMTGKLEIYAGISTYERKGFFTNFYVPFFKAMKAAGHMETAGYLLLTSNKDEQTNNWLALNDDKVKAFRQWMQDYQWIDKTRL